MDNLTPIDFTLLLRMRPQLRTRDAIVSALQKDPGAIIMIRFDNSRGDRLKPFASRLFPQIHAEIHSRQWEAIGFSTYDNNVLRAFLVNSRLLCIAVEGAPVVVVNDCKTGE